MCDKEPRYSHTNSARTHASQTEGSHTRLWTIPANLSLRTERIRIISRDISLWWRLGWSLPRARNFKLTNFQLQLQKVVPMVKKTCHVKLFLNRTTFTAAPRTLNINPGPHLPFRHPVLHLGDGNPVAASFMNAIKLRNNNQRIVWDVSSRTVCYLTLSGQ